MIGRRNLLISAAAGGPLAAASAGAIAQPPTAGEPELEFVLEMAMRTGEVQLLGPSPQGERRFIPLLGGTFQGPRLRGTIGPGGARHLVRADRMDETHATLDLHTDDGAVIGYSDQGLRDMTDDPPHVLTSPQLTAPPTGPHAWLNRRVFVSTVRPAALPEGDGVRVRVYALRWRPA